MCTESGQGRIMAVFDFIITEMDFSLKSLKSVSHLNWKNSFLTVLDFLLKVIQNLLKRRLWSLVIIFVPDFVLMCRCKT